MCNVCVSLLHNNVGAPYEDANEEDAHEKNSIHDNSKRSATVFPTRVISSGKHIHQ